MKLAPDRVRGGRGALLVIACLLACSSVLRAATGSGAAFGRELETLQVASPAPAPEPEIARLLDDLLVRERDLAEKERILETREQAIDLAETRAREEIRKLKEAEDAIRATMALADSAAEDDLAQLTAVYENMKPQQAAPLFQRMTPVFAAGFLGRMRPDAAAAILAGLDPENAYAISVILAGRNAKTAANDR